MGAEATCKCVLNGQTSTGKAHCGDGEIDFRGDFRFKWLWQDLSQVEAHEGILTIRKGDEQAELHLGEQAERWRQSILNPKSRIEKFGLKPGHRYRAWGEFDEAFAGELQAAAGAPTSEQLDAIFVRLDAQDDLAKLLAAKQEIVDNGMIWAVWPKGRKEFTETHVRNYAVQHGLVDVKIARFSDLLASIKLVIPLKDRGKRAEQKEVGGKA